jgi:hypothetical protein
MKESVMAVVRLLSFAAVCGVLLQNVFVLLHVQQVPGSDLGLKLAGLVDVVWGLWP